MNRRRFLKTMFAAVVAHGAMTDAAMAFSNSQYINRKPARIFSPDIDQYIKDYLHKIKNFDKEHADDIYLDKNQYRLLKICTDRLSRLQRTVGHGNFHLLSFDEALKVASNYQRIGKFTRQELDFLEMLFYEDSTSYGFLGDKVLTNLTDRIQKRKVTKVPKCGNYLYKGLSLDTYHKIKKEVGSEVYLTSGVRSVMKQFLLFLNKAAKNKGNLSLASRSLAPPGYSYHGIGDFDVGQVGLGSDNFTDRFTGTRVFKRLQDLGYLQLRYTENNLFGVRFEPWHIKVTLHG